MDIRSSTSANAYYPRIFSFNRAGKKQFGAALAQGDFQPMFDMVEAAVVADGSFLVSPIQAYASWVDYLPSWVHYFQQPNLWVAKYKSGGDRSLKQTAAMWPPSVTVILVRKLLRRSSFVSKAELRQDRTVHRLLQPNNGQALPLDLRRKTSNRVSRNESCYSARRN